MLSGCCRPVSMCASSETAGRSRRSLLGYNSSAASTRKKMYTVFNMGIGLVLIVAPFFADSIRRMLNARQTPCWEIGEVAEGTGRLVWT